MSEIHPTAVIYDGARLGEDCSVGPYSIIGPHVVLGRRNRIGPHVVIEGHTRLGDENQVFQFASLGSIPQDLKYHGEPSQVVIGNRNIIREYVTIQPGTEGGGMKTEVGDGNLFMACSHVGHDSIIGNFNIFANCGALAGHVTVGNRVTVGGLAAVHQFSRLGDYCFLAGGAMAAQDVPPYCLAEGDRARLLGLNKIGLLRAGFSPEDLARLKKVYRAVFGGEGPFAERLAAGAALAQGFEAGQKFIDFLSAESKRGILSADRGAAENEADDA